METRETRLSTRVFFDQIQERELPVFETRSFYPSDSILATPYSSNLRFSHAKVWNLLKEMFRAHVAKLKDKDSSSVQHRVARNTTSWADKVNKKRELVAKIIRRQSKNNFASIRRITGCTYSLIKGVYNDLLFNDTHRSFNYSKQKTAEEMSQFEESLSSLQGSFKTISDLRRENPTCSRKWIGKQLRKAGYKWRMLPRQRKHPKKERPNAKEVVAIISHLVQAMKTQDTEIIYIDEVHFPLFQTADHRWTLALQAEDQVYNRRPVAEEKLSVVAACTLNKFIAVQVFRRDVTCNDFLFLLQAVLEKCDPKSKVTVLADRATWHTSQKVMATEAGKFIHLNVPGLFRVNAIENCFSFVRAEFRKRPLVHSLEEEAALLINIFFDSKNKERFKGIHKNHLRQMILLMKENSPALKNVEDEILKEL